VGALADLLRRALLRQLGILFLEGRIMRAICLLALPWAACCVAAATGSIAACVSDGGANQDVRDASLDDAVDASADTAPADASVTDPAADAAKPACDLSKPFGPPNPVAGPSPTAPDGWPRLSPDELTMVFSCDLGDAGVGKRDLCITRRSNPNAPFGPAALIPIVNSVEDEVQPMLSPDQLSLYFVAADPPFTNRLELYVATRSNIAADFSPRVALTALNTPANEREPFVSWDGTELFFTSQTAQGVPFDLYRASRVGSAFANSVPVTELNTGAEEFSPVLSADGKRIFFASRRSDGGAQGGADIWTATRTSPSTPFGSPTSVTEVNTSAEDVPGWLSSDACRLYLHSDRSGSGQIYVASRSQ